MIDEMIIQIISTPNGTQILTNKGRIFERIYLGNSNTYSQWILIPSPDFIKS